MNSSVCDDIARLIAHIDVPEDREDSALPRIPREVVGNFYLSLVAICHQTSPRGQMPLQGIVDGTLAKGWDYLFKKLELFAGDDPTILQPRRWARITASDIQGIFSDATFGERLTDPERRAVLLRDLGSKMERNGWARADCFYEQSTTHAVLGIHGLLSTLRQFEAYGDPVAKKSLFFLALMRNSGHWHYADSEDLAAPVDYHEVRGHLRIGTVRITDRNLETRVRNGTPVSGAEDVAIRFAVSDAILRISSTSGLRDPSRLHYLFWNVFRTVCTRQLPKCFGSSDSPLPVRYRHVGGTPLANQCPFAEHCHSAGSPDPICDHVVETDYY